jgi:hypothetical protein
MGRGFNNDILTLGVLAIGGYLIYTKTDWFQQLFDAVKDIMGDIKGGGLAGRRPSGGSSGVPSGGGGGDISGGNASAGKGQFMFPGTGKTWTAKDSGKTKRNYASGGSSGTTQWDIKNVGPVSNIETELWVNVGGCGDSVSTKVFGPDHSGSNCCWVILNVDCASGNFELGSEGPHPSTSSSNLGKGQSMGSIKNKEVGIKLVVTKSGSGYIAKGYGNTGGGWKEYLSANFTQFGVSKKSGTPHGSANVQFRTDCSGVKYSVARAQEIAGGASSGYTKLSAGQYSNSLFTHNKPIPVNFYYSRYTIPQVYCDQLPKRNLMPCYDRNDY